MTRTLQYNIIKLIHIKFLRLKLLEQNILISVIIPIYNVENYLKQCLDSILNQTFQDFEIICIDDGSKDSSLKILHEYVKKDKRIRVIEQQNCGAGIARNNGITLAKGEYIQFLDADDYFEPNLLETLYNIIKTQDSDIAVCSYRKVDNNGNITESRNPNSPINLDKTPILTPFNYKDFKEDIFSLLTPIPWNKLYRKSLLIEHNIKFPNLRICEDVAFVHSCIAIADKIIVTDSELINYRFARPQSMASYRTKYTIDIVHSCLELKKFLQKNNLFDQLKVAYTRVFQNHLRWEIALCDEINYKNFLKEFKTLLPNEWQDFKNILKKEEITLDYLYKFIGNKKIMFWGASFFLQKLLETETCPKDNILGVIDRNTASWGNFCGKYKIFPPESINTIKPDAILMTIWSNHDSIYPLLKEELKAKYPQTELLPNIFETQIDEVK